MRTVGGSRSDGVSQERARPRRLGVCGRISFIYFHAKERRRARDLKRSTERKSARGNGRTYGAIDAASKYRGGARIHPHAEADAPCYKTGPAASASRRAKRH